MKNSTKIMFAPLLFVIMFFIFNFIEFEQLNPTGNKYLQSFIFSSTAVISIFMPKHRNKLFLASFFLLFLMAVFYLTNKLTLSNSLASIGIGMLSLTAFSYLPQIFKKGYIEKL